MRIYLDVSGSMCGFDRHKIIEFVKARNARNTPVFTFNDQPPKHATGPDSIQFGGGTRFDHVVDHAHGMRAWIITDGLEFAGKPLPDNFSVIELNHTEGLGREWAKKSWTEPKY